MVIISMSNPSLLIDFNIIFKMEKKVNNNNNSNLLSIFVCIDVNAHIC